MTPDVADGEGAPDAASTARPAYASDPIAAAAHREDPRLGLEPDMWQMPQGDEERPFNRVAAVALALQLVFPVVVVTLQLTELPWAWASFALPVTGLLLGIRVRRATYRSRERGREMATWAIYLGALFLLIGVFALLIIDLQLYPHSRGGHTGTTGPPQIR